MDTWSELKKNLCGEKVFVVEAVVRRGWELEGGYSLCHYAYTHIAHPQHLPVSHVASLTLTFLRESVTHKLWFQDLFIKKVKTCTAA